MFHRILNPLKSNSFFIFGARGTGKSTWIKNQFDAQDVFFIDLLKPEIEDLYRRTPQLLKNKSSPWNQSPIG